ncbi:glycosyltransferase [Myxococcota bacterium]|nr:glycosyltransferase [Myxococcota bacterium]
MAKIVLATVGTTGDVLPYVALGRALVARGHDVVVCSHDLHAARFSAAGLRFVAVGAPLGVDAFNRTMDAIHAIEEPIPQFERLCTDVFLASPAKQLADHRAVSQGADLVVAHWFDYVAQEAAIQNGVPWIGMTYMPEVLRTDEAPIFPYLSIGPWWTKATWDAALERAAPLTRRVREILATLGARDRELAMIGALSPLHNFLAASSYLVDVRSDWPATFEVTGSWFDDAPEHVPEPELAAFLDAHERPIVVSFGSMGGTRGEETSRTLMEAIAATGRSAIVQRGFTGLTAIPSDRVLPIGYVPHDFLFAHAGCVVHHAGSGTAAAVARAGVPSVPVPHLFDQYYWAGMLRRRRAATEPVFRNKLSADVLAERIEEAMTAEDLRTYAAALGRAVRSEAGVDAAVTSIENILLSGASEPRDEIISGGDDR